LIAYITVGLFLLVEDYSKDCALSAEVSTSGFMVGYLQCLLRQEEWSKECHGPCKGAQEGVLANVALIS
jgi:hypothetical protein